MFDNGNPFDPETQKQLLGSNVNPATGKRITKEEVVTHMRRVSDGAKRAILNARVTQ